MSAVKKDRGFMFQSYMGDVKCLSIYKAEVTNPDMMHPDHSLLDDYRSVQDPTSDPCIYYCASSVRCKLSSTQCAWRRACGLWGCGGGGGNTRAARD